MDVPASDCSGAVQVAASASMGNGEVAAEVSIGKGEVAALTTCGRSAPANERRSKRKAGRSDREHAPSLVRGSGASRRSTASPRPSLISCRCGISRRCGISAAPCSDASPLSDASTLSDSSLAQAYKVPTSRACPERGPAGSAGRICSDLRMGRSSPPPRGSGDALWAPPDPKGTCSGSGVVIRGDGSAPGGAQSEAGGGN